MGKKIYARDVATTDGLITNARPGDLGNANTSFTYIDLAKDGYKYLSLEHILTATTLTIEGCNVGYGSPQLPLGANLVSVADGTDATGATITDTVLSLAFGQDEELNQIQVRILRDETTPANVGHVTTVVAYDAFLGTITLETAAPGPTTAGSTEYRLEDNPYEFGRKMIDPDSSQWLDVTSILTGAASHTTSGVWFFDTEILMERFRIRRVTTNATNACTLRLSRGR